MDYLPTQFPSNPFYFVIFITSLYPITIYRNYTRTIYYRSPRLLDFSDVKKSSSICWFFFMIINCFIVIPTLNDRMFLSVFGVLSFASESKTPFHNRMILKTKRKLLGSGVCMVIWFYLVSYFQLSLILSTAAFQSHLGSSWFKILRC